MENTQTKTILSLEEKDNFSLSIIDVKPLLVNLSSKEQRLKLRELNKKAICDLAHVSVTDFYKDENGKPWTKRQGVEVSGSHTNELLAILKVHHQMAGVDIERASNRVERVAHKFINESENEFIEIGNELSYYQVIWSAKEALYKCYGRKQVDFRKHLFIHPFKASEKGELVGDIIMPNFCVRIHLSYFYFLDHVVVYSHQ